MRLTALAGEWTGSADKGTEIRAKIADIWVVRICGQVNIRADTVRLTAYAGRGISVSIEKLKNSEIEPKVFSDGETSRKSKPNGWVFLP